MAEGADDRPRRVVPDAEFERVRAGGVGREAFERLVAGLVVSLITLGAAIAVGRVADALVDDPGVDPLDGHVLLRLVPWVRVGALVAAVAFAALIVLSVARDLGARAALRRRRRDPLR